MTRRFKDRVVVITGASAGVGRATAIALAKQGARVGLIARGKEGLESARREIELTGAYTRGSQLHVVPAQANATLVYRPVETHTAARIAPTRIMNAPHHGSHFVPLGNDKSLKSHFIQRKIKTSLQK